MGSSIKDDGAIASNIMSLYSRRNTQMVSTSSAYFLRHIVPHFMVVIYGVITTLKHWLSKGVHCWESNEWTVQNTSYSPVQRYGYNFSKICFMEKIGYILIPQTRPDRNVWYDNFDEYLLNSAKPVFIHFISILIC